MTPPLLDLDPTRPSTQARDAATLILARDTLAGPEIFFVVRNQRSLFLGGAVVFPGGKVDPTDLAEVWSELSTAHATPDGFAPDASAYRALAVAALRETLEEGGILLTTGVSSDPEVHALRRRVEKVGTSELESHLRQRGLLLDVGSLRPFARWITPTSELRRYDTRFFLGRAPLHQNGIHDDRETVSTYWARPADVLARFDCSELQLAPPTHCALSELSSARDVDGMFAIAEQAALTPICPRLVSHEGTLALALPGDAEHEVAQARFNDFSRYVLRGEFWRSERGTPHYLPSR